MTVLATYYDENYVGFVSDVDVAANPPREAFKIQYLDDLSVIYSIVGDEIAISAVNLLLMWNSISLAPSKIALDQLPFIQAITAAMTHIVSKATHYRPQCLDTALQIYSGGRLFIWRIQGDPQRKAFIPLKGIPIVLPPRHLHIDWFGNSVSRPLLAPSSVSNLRNTLQNELVKEDQAYRLRLAPNSHIPPVLSGRFAAVVSSSSGTKLIDHPYLNFPDMISKFYT